MYSVMVFNIYRLQIERGDYYSARAESQYRLAGFLETKRGHIYLTDKNKNLIPAAINRRYPIIYAVPKETGNIELTAQTLSALLKLDFEKIKTQLSKENDLYELLVFKALPEQIQGVVQAGLDGIYIDDQEARFYPFANLASQVLGFVGPSSQDDELRGRYGSEMYFNKELAGEDIILTIDRNIQSRAEEILDGLMEKYRASGGTVIVQNPKSGAILTLGNKPDFDPNNYSESPVKNYLNPAVQSLYEPGSVFKVITMAIGIDSGNITPETEYYDSGSITLNGKTITNWDLVERGPYGRINMTRVIERSVNTGAVFAQRKIGQDIFYNYLLKFGLNEPTGIPLPGEVAGNLKNLKTSFREINFATASFGQGLSVTPIELITAISAIANRGVLMKPLILADEQPEIVRRVISEEAARQVTAMMASAVEKAGVAQIPKYRIAGKTGTAQVPDFKNGGYTDDFIHTFAGFLPASDPQFTILIKLDRPQAVLAGSTVVPAFRELAEFVLNYYNIPPDNLERN